MSKPINAYIRAQAINNAVVNAVVNPVIVWLTNRHMDFTPLQGGNSIVIDTVITSVVLTLVVTLFVSSAVQRDLHAGQVTASDGLDRRGWLLAYLPRRPWALGLTLGVCITCILTPLIYGVFTTLGLSGLSFPAFALLKALYTAVLGFSVTRWVILRQLLLAPRHPLHSE